MVLCLGTFAHTSHGGAWVLAHNVGTGPGLVAQALATRFAKVVVSEINANHVLKSCKGFEMSHSYVRFEHCRAKEVAKLGDKNAYGKANSSPWRSASLC